jgi:hypothetical protein
MRNGSQNQYYITAAKLSNWSFGRVICGRDRLRDEHLAWDSLLDKQYGLFLMPRESLKTTFFVESYISKLILDNPDIRIYLLCDTGPHAKQRVKTIKRNIQSARAEIYCPGIQQRIKAAAKWTEDEIDLPRFVDGKLQPRFTKESNLIAAGIDSPQTGIHVDLIILDDVVNREDKRSLARREMVISNFTETFDLVSKEGKILIIGTFWHPEDLYNHILKNYREFYFYRQSVFNDDGTTWLPEFYPEERLDILRRDPIHFSHQYLNVAVGGEDTKFEGEWFTCVNSAPEYSRVVWGIDPAYSSSDVKNACDNALVIFGSDLKDNVGFLNARIARESLYEFKLKILRMNYDIEYYPEGGIVIEDNGTQKAALELMKENPFQRDTDKDLYNRYAKLSYLMIGTGKEGYTDLVTRSQSLADYAELHGCYYVDTPGNNQLIEQLLLFPAIEKDDGCSAAFSGFLRAKPNQIVYPDVIAETTNESRFYGGDRVFG